MPKKLSIDLLSIDRCERVHELPDIAGAVAEKALPPKPEAAAQNKTFNTFVSSVQLYGDVSWRGSVAQCTQIVSQNRFQ